MTPAQVIMNANWLKYDTFICAYVRNNLLKVEHIPYNPIKLTNILMDNNKHLETDLKHKRVKNLSMQIMKNRILEGNKNA